MKKRPEMAHLKKVNNAKKLRKYYKSNEKVALKVSKIWAFLALKSGLNSDKSSNLVTLADRTQLAEQFLPLTQFCGSNTGTVQLLKDC